MVLPPGFAVELVASEPEIVNPVAMTFDAQGRIWITESLDYPRQEAGPGRDRIKIIEDTDGDGRADRFTIFAEGLNIPSGIAVGFGGVWVASAPTFCFLKTPMATAMATSEKSSSRVLDATIHTVPTPLTWGPDSWLYGLNGVFNPARIEHRGRRHEFTCALFRIHPRTRDFQVVAEGTSNPWGVAWDVEGSAFVSACVIDHLWHLAETGYYTRQGGPYPPFTVPMGSIVAHKHQKAAYCGIHFFDSDAYPPEYRERLYMGNIHGNSVNVDVLARDGSTYVGTAAPDFLTANDAWFMPVVQKTGPDGCLYILDWYDQYHCYQDARRDPAGIDRLKGRLYRVRYRDTPRAARFDLASESDQQLINRLASPNVYFRDVAQRILCERNDPETKPRLQQLVSDEAATRKTRMHALWALVGAAPLSLEFHLALLGQHDPGFRAWAVRPEIETIDPPPAAAASRSWRLARDPAPEVRLQVAIAARKLEGVDPLGVLLEVLSNTGDDKLIRHIVWQNLHPLLETRGEQFLQLIAAEPLRDSRPVQALMPRVIDRILAAGQPRPIAALIHFLFDAASGDPSAMGKCLAALTVRLENREMTGEQLSELRPRLEPVLRKILSRGPGDPLGIDAALLASAWRDPDALAAVRALLSAKDQPAARRAQALDVLVSVDDASLEASVAQLLTVTGSNPLELRSSALASLARFDAPWVPRVVLAEWTRLEPELRPWAIELLTQRRAWAEQLLDAIGRKEIPASALNVNQVRQLLVGADAALAAKVADHWGAMRTQRDPRRDEVIAQMRAFLRRTPGDPRAGREVFNRVCGQCHKLYGAGQDVGPDITLNGRNSFEQLLSNVFDPSLVVGAAYQARTIVTEDGRVLTGLVVEDSPQHVSCLGGWWPTGDDRARGNR